MKDGCDREIFEKGDPLMVVWEKLECTPQEISEWIARVAEEANTRIDWHYSGGRAHVLHLGDEESRKRAIEVAQRLEPEFKGKIAQIFEVGDPGLYRNGVTPVPEGAIAACYDGGPGSSFLVKPT